MGKELKRKLKWINRRDIFRISLSNRILEDNKGRLENLHEEDMSKRYIRKKIAVNKIYEYTYK